MNREHLVEIPFTSRKDRKGRKGTEALPARKRITEW
jgi:hypothetical protein